MQKVARDEISNTTLQFFTGIMLEQTISILTQILFKLLKNVNELNTFSDIKPQVSSKNQICMSRVLCSSSKEA